MSVGRVLRSCNSIYAIFFLSQSRDQQVIQLESDLKDYEEQITNLKTQVFQEQQKLYDCESEWKENMAKQGTHAKALKIEVRKDIFILNFLCRST